jgi:hypothetical protein
VPVRHFFPQIPDKPNKNFTTEDAMPKKTPAIFMISFSAALFILAAVASFETVRNACAFNLNCGNSFVSEGVSKLEVIRTCGEPILKEIVGTIKQRYGNTVVELVIEHWYYTETWRASEQDMRLIFYGSDLVEIERADGRFR